MKKSLKQSIVRQLQTSDPKICSRLLRGKKKAKPLPISVRPFLKDAHKFKFEMLVLEEESDLSDDPNEVSESDEVSDVAPDSEIEE